MIFIKINDNKQAIKNAIVIINVINVGNKQMLVG